MSLLAVRGHVREDAEQEVSFQVWVKGRGYDDVAPLCQVDAEEHGPGVDVDAPTDLLLGGVHPVGPVQLHLRPEGQQQVSRHNLMKDKSENPLFLTLQSRSRAKHASFSV